MRWQNTETPTFAGSAGSAGEPAIVETMQLLDHDGNEVAAFEKSVDGNVTMSVDGQPKVYRALLTQTGTDDPVATVLENTLGGEVVWSYSDVGVYIATLAGVFTASKTAINISAFNGIATGARDDANSVSLSVFRASDNDPFNGLLTATFIEILVYP